MNQPRDLALRLLALADGDIKTYQWKLHMAFPGEL